MPAPYDEFKWREVQPGTWWRDVDEAESFYHHLMRCYEGSGRKFFFITGHTTLIVDKADGDSNDIASRVDAALRLAWLQLRLDCPTVASQIVYDSGTETLKKQYNSFAVGDSPEPWLQETFQRVSNGQTGVEWCNSDPPAPNLATLFVIVPPSENGEGTVRRDLVLRAPHDVIDGMGTLHLLNNLVVNAAAAYANPSAINIGGGEEVTNLSPPLRVAAGISPSIPPDQKLRLPKIELDRSQARSGVTVATIPFKRGPLVPGKHLREAILLSKERTSALLAVCKKMAVTPTHVFHAAISLALRDVQEQALEPRKLRYISYILSDDRSQCKGEYATAKHAAAVYHSVLSGTLYVDLVVPAKDATSDPVAQKEEFLRVLAYMKGFYSSVRENKDDIQLAPLSWSKGCPPWRPSTDGKLPPVPAPKDDPTVSISSFGLIDKIIQPTNGVFSVSSPWVTGEELGTGLGLFLGTFRNQLELSCAFNDVWHDQQEALQFLENCLQIVFNSLEIATLSGTDRLH